MGSRGWSGSCTPDARGRGAGTTRAAERVLTGPPSLCRQHNDCAVPPRAWFHHHARQQRRLWPIRPVGPSAFTVTTTPLCCTPLCLGSTAHDDEPDHSSKMETGSLVKQVRLLGLVPRPLGRTIVAETTGGVRAAGVVDADGAVRSRAGLCAHRVVLLGSTWIRGSRV